MTPAALVFIQVLAQLCEAGEDDVLEELDLLEATDLSVSVIRHKSDWSEIRQRRVCQCKGVCAPADM